MIEKNRNHFFVLTILLYACGGGGTSEPSQQISNTQQSLTAQQMNIEICIERFIFSENPSLTYDGAEDYVLLNENISLNDNGIVQIDYGNDQNIGLQITPITIFDYVRRAYSDYCLSKDEKYKTIIFKHADFLVETVSDDRSYASWNYDFSFSRFELNAGWTSSLGNSSAMLVLLMAYSLEQNERYIATIESALQGFLININQDGLMHPANGGGTWFEEYPNPQNPSTVLNGHLFSIMALSYISDNLLLINESATIGMRESANELVASGIEAVIQNAYLFDNEKRNTTYYSLSEAEDDIYSLPNTYWGYIHVYGLMWIYNKVGNNEMKLLSEKWQGYIDKYLGS